MNREIKFRGKRIDNEEWVYGYFYTIQNKEHYILQPCTLGVEHVEVNSDTVGQFTVLKDKNGKEIYDGDIIKIFDEEGFIKTVSTQIPCGCCDLCVGELNRGESVFCQIEVIGNIHDNPELINK